MISCLDKHGIKYSSLSGVTPDGAADGHCALNLIPELMEKVDTCMLHGLQRAVLFSIGMTGTPNKNLECATLLKQHRR